MLMLDLFFSNYSGYCGVIVGLILAPWFREYLEPLLLIMSGYAIHFLKMMFVMKQDETNWNETLSRAIISLIGVTIAVISYYYWWFALIVCIALVIFSIIQIIRASNRIREIVLIKENINFNDLLEIIIKEAIQASLSKWWWLGLALPFFTNWNICFVFAPFLLRFAWIADYCCGIAYQTFSEVIKKEYIEPLLKDWEWNLETHELTNKKTGESFNLNSIERSPQEKNK